MQTVITRTNVYYRYEIMMICWQNDPDARPTFADLRNKLKEMGRQHKVRLLALKTLLDKDVCTSVLHLIQRKH